MPIAKILEQKKAVVEALAEDMRNAASAVLVKNEGITVDNDTKMRAALRAANVKYAVIKNTLISKACDQTGFEALKPQLEGMNALAISFDDPIAPAKILKEYADKIDSFELKGGFVDGEILDKKGGEELAAIPPKPMLVGKMLGSLQKSLYGLCYVLQAKIDKENGGAEAPAEA